MRWVMCWQHPPQLYWKYENEVNSEKAQRGLTTNCRHVLQYKKNLSNQMASYAFLRVILWRGFKTMLPPTSLRSIWLVVKCILHPNNKVHFDVKEHAPQRVVVVRLLCRSALLRDLYLNQIVGKYSIHVCTAELLRFVRANFRGLLEFSRYLGT